MTRDSSQHDPSRIVDRSENASRDGAHASSSSLAWSLRGLGFVALVGLGVLLRWSWADWPNFSPVAGLALTAGVLLRSRVLAIAVPLITMLLSDLVLGGYDLPVMLTVYACLMVPGLMGDRYAAWQLSTPTRPVWRSALLGGVAGVALGVVSATLFFVVTNAAYWLFMTRGAGSLWDAYLAAVPFYRASLTSDILVGASGVMLASGLRAAWRTASRSSAVAVVEN